MSKSNFTFHIVVKTHKLLKYFLQKYKSLKMDNKNTVINNIL